MYTYITGYLGAGGIIYFLYFIKGGGIIHLHPPSPPAPYRVEEEEGGGGGGSGIPEWFWWSIGAEDSVGIITINADDVCT